MKHGKKYFNALKKAPKKPVSIEEAVKFVKANPGAKFDETVDVYFCLGKGLTKGASRWRCSRAASRRRPRRRRAPISSAWRT